MNSKIRIHQDENFAYVIKGIMSSKKNSFRGKEKILISGKDCNFKSMLSFTGYWENPFSCCRGYR